MQRIGNHTQKFLGYDFSLILLSSIWGGMVKTVIIMTMRTWVLGHKSSPQSDRKSFKFWVLLLTYQLHRYVYIRKGSNE